MEIEQVHELLARDVLKNRIVPEAFLRRYAFAQRLAAGHNEIAVVLKPEALGRSLVGIKRMLRHVVRFLKAEGLSYSGVAVCTGSWLSQNSAMTFMYPILNHVCNTGILGLSEMARHRLVQIMGEKKVVAAHAIIEYGTSIEQLENLVRAGETAKLGTGSYLTKIELNGEDAFVINGFHPWQERHFYDPQGAIIVFRCMLDGRISELNTRFGDIDPQYASQGTLRRQFFELSQDFEIAPPSISRNCIHLSPSALDAMFLLARVFGTGATTHDRYAETTFGRRLGRDVCDERCLSQLPFLQVQSGAGLQNWILEEAEWKDAAEIVSIFESMKQEIRKS